MCKVIVLVGESSSGKDTIYKELVDTIPNLRECVSHTTRPPRDGEIDGITYNFISDMEFAIKQINNEFIETRYYNTVNGLWKYGVCKNSIDIDSNNIYIVILDLTGLKEIEKYVGKENVTSIYIRTSPHVRYLRSLDRQSAIIDSQYSRYDFSTLDEILRRFKDDSVKFAKATKVCDITLNNNSLKEKTLTLQLISKLVESLSKINQTIL